MHKSFPDWYQIAAIKPTAEMLAKRWAAVEVMANWATRSVLLDLVRVVRGTAPADASINTAVAEAARAADPTFSTRDNDAELRILAGATIAKKLEAPSSPADLVALGLVTSSLQGTLGDELLREFLPFAQQYLANEAVRVRGSSTQRAEIPVAPDLKAVLTTYREAMNGAANPPGAAVPIETMVKAAITQTVELLRNHAQQIHDELDALREESNMFWWVFAGHSRDIQKSFRDVGVPATCLVAAKELADLTELHPGPRATLALLQRVLSDAGNESAGTVKISTAVTSAPRDWRKKLIDRYPASSVREVTPLLTAVQKSLETDDPKDWISLFSKATGLQDQKLTAAALAMQAYLEAILSGVSKQVKE